MIVDVETERTGEIVFNKLAEARFAVNDAFGCADNVVSIWK